MKIIFRWYDIWIGAFIDSAKGLIYIFPIPMIGFVLKILPKGYYFNESYSSETHKYCLFYEGEQVGAFKTYLGGLKYAHTHNNNQSI